MSRSVDPIEENPYAPPASGRPGSAKTDVYKLSLRGVTVRELRRFTPGRMMFALLWLVKLLRIPLTSLVGTPRFDRLALVPYDEVPEESRDAWRAGEEACRELGMARRFSYRSPIIAAGLPDYVTIYQSDDHRMFVGLVAQWERGKTPETVVGTIGAVSRTRGGGWLASTNHRISIDPPPHYEQRKDPAWSARDLLAEHRRWIDGRADEVEPIDPDRLLDLQTAREREFMQYQIDRRILVPMTERELDALHRRIEEGPSASPSESPRVTTLKLYESLAFLAMIGSFVLIVALPDNAVVGLVAVGVCLLLALGLRIARGIVAKREKARTQSRPAHPGKDGRSGATRD